MYKNSGQHTTGDPIYGFCKYSMMTKNNLFLSSCSLPIYTGVHFKQTFACVISELEECTLSIYSIDSGQESNTHQTLCIKESGDSLKVNFLEMCLYGTYFVWSSLSLRASSFLERNLVQTNFTSFMICTFSANFHYYGIMKQMWILKQHL